MQRKIHTFRAATMDQALDLVRRELGQDAVVVDSREVSTRRILPWPSTRQEIEVSAELKSRQTASRAVRAADDRKVPERRTIRTLAEAMSGATPARLATLTEDLPVVADEIPVVMSSTKKSRLAAQADDQPQATADRIAVQPRSEMNRSIEQSLQSILAHLDLQSGSTGATPLPAELISYYQKWVAEDISHEVACDLLTQVRQHIPPDRWSNQDAVTATLEALIERQMQCAPPIQPQPGCREIVMLVGPTGVGKTTTIAKLAGQFQLQQGLRVGLITVDSYRVGAIDQLQCYADILQIPLRAASNPHELRAAIDELDDVDVVLIDTAGRSPMDRGRMNELNELVRASGSTHVMLVLSLAAGNNLLVKIADSFASVSPTSLVVTKLDECQGCGGLLSIARDIPCPVRYLTIGQDVPEQIEPAHPNRLARLILGSDRIIQETAT